MKMRDDERQIEREPATVRREVSGAGAYTDTAYDAHGNPVRSSTVVRETTPGGYDEAVMTDVHHGYFDSPVTRINAALFAMFVGIEGLIGLRFTLLAFGANRTSSFVDFIYDVSWPFVRPFSSAFRNRTWDQGIIEVSSLLAIAIILLGYLLVTFLVTAMIPRHDTTASTVRRERLTHV